MISVNNESSEYDYASEGATDKAIVA